MELRGNTSSDMTALLYSLDSGISSPDYPSFAAAGNGFGGNNGKYRSLMKFKIRHIDEPSLDKLPLVRKAVLYLYQYHASPDLNPYRLEQDSSNGLELHRITGYWQDSTVTWSTQPALAQGSANSLEDVVTIPPVAVPLIAGTNDNQEIDVTDMMRKIFESSDNKGFLLKLTHEAGSAGRSFGSFACPNVSKRPKLVVYF